MAKRMPTARQLPADFAPSKGVSWVLRRGAADEAVLWAGPELGRQGQIWERAPKGEWGVAEDCPAPADLLQLADDVAVWISTADDKVLQRLVVTGDGEPDDHDWKFKVTSFEDEDDEFPGSYDAPHRRYARVNGSRVHFAEPDASPFLVSPDGDVHGETLASFTSAGEMGMYASQTDWCLTTISAQVAVASSTGDEACAPQALTIPGDDEAAVVAHWLSVVNDEAIGVMTAAAIELNPLDPRGELSDDERTFWASLLADLRSGTNYGETFDCTVYLDDAARGTLRGLLNSDPEYRAVSEALAAPRTKGAWLLTALQEADYAVFNSFA